MNRSENPYNADSVCRYCSTEQRDDCENEKAHCKDWEDELDKENAWQEGYDAAVEDMKAVGNAIIINGKFYQLVFEEYSIDNECSNCVLYKFCYPQLSIILDEPICNIICRGIGVSGEGRFFKEIK